MHCKLYYYFFFGFFFFVCVGPHQGKTGLNFWHDSNQTLKSKNKKKSLLFNSFPSKGSANTYCVILSPPVEGILPVFYSHTTEGQGYYSEQTAESAVVTSVQGGGPADGLEKGCVHHPDLTGQSYSYQSTLPAQCQVGCVKIKSNILYFVG